jgi:hypothetical protein
MARYVVFRHFAGSIDPNGASELEKDVNAVYALASDLEPDRTRLAAAADTAAGAASALEEKVKSAAYDRSRTDSLLRDITSDGDAIAFQGERSAEQATMAIDSLYIAETKQSTQNPEIRSAIDGMYKLLENPSAYNAPAFAAQMRKVRAALGSS